MKSDSNDYVIRVFSSPLEIPANDWNALLAGQGEANPFMRHEYLAALHQSGSATPATGWTPRFVTLWRGPAMVAACALYLKDHSYGEYVFDWAWANAYEQHGLAYYPKAVVASPFTPVPGVRLLARDAPARQALVKALVDWCGEQKLSSLHLLFAGEDDVAACAQAGLMLRHTVQFHWKNVAPTLVALRTALDESPPDATTLRPVQARAGGLGAAGPFGSFEDFLASLSHDKRKKIRQERRKVADAGVSFRWSLGRDIAPRDWDFFYRCYERTYYEHGNAPYLSRDFFRRMAGTMPENWLLFVAERGGKPIATSLIAVSDGPVWATGQFSLNNTQEAAGPVVERTAYGRYWGALERVDCLHFEACYYQPLQWCIEHGFQRFEGGAQGEHKMARALLPVKTTSAHWLAHPAFADAVERFLAREGEGIEHYMDELERRNPFKHADAPS
ncbi:GNAT family N-acetyltransferase [Polaromonas sp. C04]|uniref:GNAT family N-acetyltransferase n=1 Tax=Polaromonas sp. C04 TaxID=1945857 RepID=UPI0009CBADAA|nr:GNAT family N-acetyltransferase [Polaromonas sp. C04]OOG54302.1 GNAT family N-acetyltransferase [Polaromonas sp. C04]